MKRTGLKIAYIFITILLEIAIADSALGVALRRDSDPNQQKPLSTGGEFLWSWNGETINSATPNSEKQFTGEWWTATFERLEFTPPSATQGSKIFITLAGIHKNPNVPGHIHGAAETFRISQEISPRSGSVNFEFRLRQINFHEIHTDSWNFFLTANVDNNMLFSDGTIFLGGKHSTPEPTSTISLLALGTLGAASTFKRKLKPSKPTEKETTTVG